MYENKIYKLLEQARFLVKKHNEAKGYKNPWPVTIGELNRIVNKYEEIVKMYEKKFAYNKFAERKCDCEKD